MVEWKDGLKVKNHDLYMDTRQPKERAFVSHGHSDHIATHDVSICTAPTADFCSFRISNDACHRLEYEDVFNLGKNASIQLHPSGHVLGGAMARIRTDEGTLLYTGDFKLQPSLSVPLATPEPADYLLIESTFGIPLFRFPPVQQSRDRLVELVAGALREGRQPIVLGYSLGKAQEIVMLLQQARLTVTEHGAVANMTDIYRSHGVAIGPTRRYKADDFHGPGALSLEERGVLVAPPQVARTSFVNRFEKPLTIMLSGWAMMKGAEYRYGVDHVLPISDHADFDDLIATVERVNPKKVFTTHGYKEFVDHLRKRGFNASLAKPEAQLELFE